tara:strand:- start:4286 stop:5128 length:843 start_codon:yes stop_codon:yes gene_type:complete
MKNKTTFICAVLLLFNVLYLMSQNTGYTANTWYKINSRGKFVTKVHASGDYSEHDVVIHIINVYYNTAEVTYLSEFNYNHKRVKLEWGFTGNNENRYVVVRLVPVTASFANSFVFEDVSDPTFDYGLTVIDASLVTPITPQNRLFVDEWNGRVGIGTTSPDSKLTVKGNIHAEEVKVDLSVPAPDYVFKEDYKLKTLEETQAYIKENGHLPNMPSAQEFEENGMELGVMNLKLLEKIEELILYTINQEEEIRKLKSKDQEFIFLKREVEQLKKRVDFLNR